MAFTTEESIQPFARKYGFEFEEGMVISVYSTTLPTETQHRSPGYIIGKTDDEIATLGVRTYATQLGDFKEVCIVGGDFPVAVGITGGWEAQQGE